MKKLTLIAMLIIMISTCFCQDQKDLIKPFTRGYYLQKSHDQKATGWILLSVGALASAGGIVWALGDVFSQDETPDVLFFSGLGIMAASIPFFIASGRNKRKAEEAHVYLKLEKTLMPQNQSIVLKSYPAVAIRIALK